MDEKNPNELAERDVQLQLAHNQNGYLAAQRNFLIDMVIHIVLNTSIWLLFCQSMKHETKALSATNARQLL